MESWKILGWKGPQKIIYLNLLLKAWPQMRLPRALLNGVLKISSEGDSITFLGKPISMFTRSHGEKVFLKISRQNFL